MSVCQVSIYSRANHLFVGCCSEAFLKPSSDEAILDKTNCLEANHDLLCVM